MNLIRAKGLMPEEQNKLDELISVFNYHETKNRTKARYYEGHITLQEVNLGIALPRNLAGLEIGCEWGKKCVDVLASRSMFDGFVGANGETSETLQRLVDDNNLVAEYQKATKDELKFGACYATLSRDENIGCRIRFHSAKTAAGLWNGEKGRIDCGLAIVDTAPDEKDESTFIPSVVNFYTDDFLIVLTKNGEEWEAERYENPMGRPLIEPLVWNASSGKPFGSSRIKEPVRRLIQGYVRTIANATIGLEFATSPQKYLMGVTDEQYDAIVSDKFRQYVGSILAATTNPETGQNPVYGQLQQGSLTPHVEMLKILATQFSAATGLTVADTGAVNEANPTSSDAILAQSQTLVLMAEQLNAGNGSALRTIAIMAQAIAEEKRLEELTTEEKDVIAHFKNPATPSVAMTADAAIKIASARSSFAQTDTFLEMIGFSQADVRRIKAQENRARGLSILEEEFDEDSGANVE